MERVFLVLSSVSGALGVALGAFGAHGLRARLEGMPDALARRGYWETAAHYHLAHALAIALAAYVVGRTATTTAVAAGFCFAGGIVLFSGSLYLMALTGERALGAVTPFGGLLFIAGWCLVAWAAWKLR